MAAAGLLIAGNVALSQPYGWVPGSSADSTDSGNRIAVVDLGAQTILGPNNGFVFTSESSGADPLVPGFSPDGSKIYILVGGDSDVNIDGHLYTFDTASVISKLESQQNVTPTDAEQKIVLEVTEQGADDALEPVALAVTPDGSKLVMTETRYQQFFSWDIEADGLIDESSEEVIDLSADPSPPWTNNAGTRAYFCTQLVQGTNTKQDDTPPQLRIVDLTQDPPAQVAQIDVPPPPQGSGFQDINTIPFATVAFPQEEGTNYTAMQPPGIQHADDSELYIYSGYIGFEGTIEQAFPKQLVIPFSLSDPFRIYKVDTATEDFTTDGNPWRDENDIPGDADLLFAPLVHSFVSALHGQWTNAGSQVYFPPNDDPAEAVDESNDNEDLILAYGVMDPGGTGFYHGSLQGIDGNAFLGTGQLTLKDGPSGIYRYDVPAGTAPKQATQLVEVGTIDRSLTLVVGFAGDNVVVGASDGLFLLPTGEDTDASVETDSIIGIYDPGQDNLTEIQLGLVAGAYGQQPEAAGGGDAVGDFDDSGCTDINDFLLLLDNWQNPFTVNDFLNLLDNWQQGPSC